MNVKAENLAKGSGKKAQNQQQRMIVFGIIGVAVAAVVAFIVLPPLFNNTQSNIELYASLPQNQTDDGAWVLGEPDAPITLVEFADFLCPACQGYKPDVDRFIREYVANGKAKYEFRTLVTAGTDRMENASRLVECAAELKPGSFFEAYEVMFEYSMSGRLDLDVARPFAERMGLNLNELLRCRGNANQINVDLRLARALGASSTPSVFVRYNDSDPQPVANRNFAGLAQLVEAANP